MDVLEWRATPGYAGCPAGAAGWFWVAWDTVPPDEATGAAPPPRLAGYARTEDAAHAQARTAVALPPFRGTLHGPGSQTRRRQQACAPSRVAAEILRQRTLQHHRPGYAAPSGATASRSDGSRPVGVRAAWLRIRHDHFARRARRRGASAPRNIIRTQ